MTITSPQNQKLKEIRKLGARRSARATAGRFVAEGEDLLAAADAAGWPALDRFCAAGSGLPGIEVEPALLDAAAGLRSGTRALAVYEERWAAAPAGQLCVYLHGVHDPGNVGAVLRSVEAFGGSCVALGPGSADPYGPKAVRASMGAVFSVPLTRVESMTDLPGQRIALVPGPDGPDGPEGPDAGAPLAEVWRSSSAPRNQNAKVAEGPAITLMIGAEREGLPAELITGADHVAYIPIRSHSLNAAMAATVALYEVTRMAPDDQ